MTSDPRTDALRQALEALEDHAKQYPHMQKGYTVDAITALRAVLEQPAQEPVAWFDPDDFTRTVSDPTEKEHAPLFTHPPRREWRGLTEEEIADAQDAAAIQFRKSQHGVRGQQIMPSDSPDWWLARAIEAKLKEKNHE